MKLFKKIGLIVSGVVGSVSILIGTASAQLTTYYPASSDAYTQSLSNGVFQNTAFTLGQASNATTLLVPAAEIILVIVVILAIVAILQRLGLIFK